MEFISSNVEILTTYKGKPCFFVDNHQYVFNYHGRNLETTWRCARHQSENCRAVIKTSNEGAIVHATEHICKCDSVKTEVKKALLRARKRIVETGVHWKEIYKAEVCPLKSRGAEFAAQVPSEATFRRLAQSQRKKLRMGLSTENENDASSSDSLKRGDSMKEENEYSDGRASPAAMGPPKPRAKPKLDNRRYCASSTRRLRLCAKRLKRRGLNLHEWRERRKLQKEAAASATSSDQPAAGPSSAAGPSNATGPSNAAGPSNEGQEFIVTENESIKQEPEDAASTPTIGDLSAAYYNATPQFEMPHTSSMAEEQDTAALSTATDEPSNDPSDIAEQFVMAVKKRFVDVEFFVRSLQNINNHGGEGCSFADMDISGECKNGWIHGIELSCRICFTTVTVWLEDPGSKTVVSPSVAGTTTVEPPHIAEKVSSNKRKASYQKTPAPPSGPPIQQLHNFAVTWPRPIVGPQTIIPYHGCTDNGLYPINPPQSINQHNPSLPINQHNPSHSINQTFIDIIQQNPSLPINQQSPSLPVNQQNLSVPINQHNLAQPMNQHNPSLPISQHNPSHSINQTFIDQAPFIKQEIVAPEDIASPFTNTVPLSSTQPAAVQLLFSVEPSPDSNAMSSSAYDSATLSPGGALRNKQTTARSSQISENETIVPDFTTTEVLPVDLNIVKKEVEDVPPSMELDNIPRLVPMSETSLIESEASVVSDRSPTETEYPRDPVPVGGPSVIPSTITSTSGNVANQSASVVGAKDSAISFDPSFLTNAQTPFQQVVSSSEKATLKERGMDESGNNVLFENKINAKT